MDDADFSKHEIASKRIPATSDNRLEWRHAACVLNPPLPEWSVLLTKTVRHMTPEIAREVAADLLAAADVADAIRNYGM